MKSLDSVPVYLTGKTLLAILLDRRPELENIELTCANTNTTMPYIDLVNEVMESYIAFSTALPSQAPRKHFNTEEEATDDILAQAPRHINRTVYENTLQDQVYPMEVFPYNHAVDCLRSFAISRGTTLVEMRRNFISPQRVLSSQTPSNRQVQLAESVLRRAVAAEELGLFEEDFTAITGENFRTPILELNHCTSGMLAADKIPLYWGYADEASMLDQKDGNGLFFIRTQFLRRSGLSLAEVVEILQTQYIGGRLILTTSDGCSQFNNRLDDLRLRTSVLLRPTGELDVDICGELQAFLRLRQKLGWSISLLDAAWSCLARNRQTAVRGIPAEWIEELAAMKRLSHLSGIELQRILPLWADMDTNGGKSLYAQLFLNSKQRGEESLFAWNDEEGRYLPPNSKHTLAQVSTCMTGALRVSLSELSSIIKGALLGFDSPLTVSNVNAVYRVAVFCQTFSIAYKDYETYRSIFGESQLEFDFPVHTLARFQKWRRWVEDGWTLSNLATVLHGAVESIEGAPNAAITALSQLMAADVGLSAKWQSPTNGHATTEEDVVRFAHMVFDIQSAPDITRFVEVSIIPETLRNHLQLHINEKEQITKITLVGKLSADELNEALMLEKNSELREKFWKPAFDQLNTAANVLESLLAAKLALLSGDDSDFPHLPADGTSQDQYNQKLAQRRELCTECSNVSSSAAVAASDF
ncbi:hypothetical protein N7454_001541 [Penicillium verhagenii]|nr:hypothetical protein N7454_001541 [Penicillium verhagenii]